MLAMMLTSLFIDAVYLVGCVGCWRAQILYSPWFVLWLRTVFSSSVGKRFDVVMCIFFFIFFPCCVSFVFVFFRCYWVLPLLSVSLGLFWVGGLLQDFSEFLYAVLYLSKFTDHTYLWLA